MTRLLMFSVAALLAMSSSALGEPYWITYEGNDLPENEGWNRSWGNDDGQYHGDGAYRTVENGILTMDSLYDLRVYDYAYLVLPGQVDPEPGEAFVAEWRLKVDDTIGDDYDASVAIISDDAWSLAFGCFPDRLESLYEDNVSIPITPGAFHEYRVLSSDMQTYQLYVDEELAHHGAFLHSVGASYVAWGDGVRGAANRSHWDSFHFGVIPEPSSLLMLMGLCACAARRRRWLGEIT